MSNPCKDGIVLIGFMGAGKSTVAVELGHSCHLPVLDLDREIEHFSGRSIPEIFADSGEEAFRRSETEVLRRLLDQAPLILATGGGVIGRSENWPLLRQLGRVVYLRVSWETLLVRIGAGEGRPLAGDRECLQALFEQRLPLYEKADLVIDGEGGSPVSVARDILRTLYWEKA
ncbi:shikimate kinase [Trichloromonas sp.]|uniref:shikimate kinase n=1 Tax=Trichloromonas sp. TaxID=3069249 RepID=UPI002A373A39|nr:shikimate kinase [Trichloromonas sp.]